MTTTLQALFKRCANRRVIHIILDNFKIHDSRQKRAFLAACGGRIRLHFLPPYCPGDNRMERCLWREVRANVTRNHRCPTIDRLMDGVEDDLQRRDRAAQRASLRAAA